MFIFKRVSHLQEWVERKKKEGQKIGFVPSMGALHSGHMSLVEKSREDSDITIVSIFVNPKQFNTPEDLVKYPRPIEKDLKILYEGGVNLVFLPEFEDIYPSNNPINFDFDPGPAAITMEGEFRPGHFAGMAEGVYRLLRITTPDALYMGQKDFQQFSIVRKLISDFKLPVDLKMCPTIREENGLAMSSRNARLSPEAREKASAIYRNLVEAKTAFEKSVDIDNIRKQFFESLKNESFDPEYFEIVNGHTFEAVESLADADQIVACCAVYVEGVRLIDNMIWKQD